MVGFVTLLYLRIRLKKCCYNVDTMAGSPLSFFFYPYFFLKNDKFSVAIQSDI